MKARRMHWSGCGSGTRGLELPPDNFRSLGHRLVDHWRISWRSCHRAL